MVLQHFLSWKTKKTKSTSKHHCGLGNETVDKKFKIILQFVIFYKLQNLKRTDLPSDGFISQLIKEDHRV